MPADRVKRQLRLAGAGFGLGLVALVCVIVFALRAEPRGGVSGAVRLMRERRVTEALSVLDPLVRAQPANSAARLARGRCYLALGRWQEARGEFEAAEQAEAGLVEAGLGLAAVLAGEGKSDEALAAAERLAESQPAAFAPSALAGRIHYQRFETATRECVRILEEDRGSADAPNAAADARAGRFEGVERYLRNGKGRGISAATLSDLASNLDRARAELDAATGALTAGCGLTRERPGAGTAEAWTLLAAIRLGKRDCEGAVSAADAALRLPDVDRPRAAALKAQALYEGAGGDAAKQEQADSARHEAVGVLEDLLRSDPHADWLRDQLVVYRVLSGGGAEALESAPSAGMRGADPRADYHRGVMYFARGKYDLAVSEILRATENMPADARHRFLLGEAYYRSTGTGGSFALAISQLRAVIEQRPSFLPARLDLARIFLRDGWFEESLTQCRQMLGIAGRPPALNTQLYLLLADVYRGLRKYDESLAWTLRGVREAPSETELMSETLILNGEDGSAGVAAKFEKTASSNPTFMCILGHWLLKEGKGKEAVERFQTALALDVQYLMGYVHLAYAYAAQDRIAEAAGQYEAAVKMNTAQKQPENASLHFGFAVLRMRQEMWDVAGQELRKVLAIEGGHAAARIRLASLEVRKRNLTGARDQVEEVIRQNAGLGQAHFLSALIDSAGASRPDAELRSDIEARRVGLPEFAGKAVTAPEAASERLIRWERALGRYESAYALDRGLVPPPEAGAAYAARGEFDKMASVFERCLAVGAPESRAALLVRQAAACLLIKDPERALKAAREAVATYERMEPADPDGLPRARFALVHCLMSNGDVGSAIAEVERAGDEASGFTQAYRQWLVRVAQLEAASRPTERGAEMVHHVVARELSLAFFFWRAGPLWQSFVGPACRRASAVDRDNIVSLHLQSSLYEATQESSKADAAARSALDASPLFGPAMRNLAIAEAERDREKVSAAADAAARLEVLARPIALYDSAIKMDPDYWLASLELAVLYDGIGAGGKAEPLYAGLVTRDAARVSVLTSLAGMAAERRAEFENVVRRARASTEHDPVGEALADALGAVGAVLAEPDPVQEQAEHARLALPDSRTIAYQLAVVCAKAGKKTRAVAILDDLLRRAAEFPDRVEAVRLRDELRKSTP